jgi:hypothetical protein
MKVATLALGLLVALTGFASGQAPDAGHSSLPPSVARFLNSRAESLTQFRAARHLEATNTRFNKHGWMDVVTELSPESGFSFQVVAEGGSDYIRKKVLRPILEGEREIVAHGEAQRSALTLDNYEMLREEPADTGLVRLFVKPKRQERTLIDGALLVTEADADLGVSLDDSPRIRRSGPNEWTSSALTAASPGFACRSASNPSPKSASPARRPCR